jgi:hypothetical protein
MTVSPVPCGSHLGLALRSGTDNNLAYINIGRLLDREQDAAGGSATILSLTPGMKFCFETRSFPTLSLSAPRHSFTFYVAHPARSILPSTFTFDFLAVCLSSPGDRKP